MLKGLFHQPREDFSSRKRTRQFRRIDATLLIFIFCAGIGSLLQAQVTSGIQGTVTDQQGQPIVGAEVLVRADATGAETKPITDSGGNFGVVGLVVSIPNATLEGLLK